MTGTHNRVISEAWESEMLAFSRAIEERARREEREACARVCETTVFDDEDNPIAVCDVLAASIRERTTDSAAATQTPD